MKRFIVALWFVFLLIFGVFAYTQEPSENNKPRQQEEQKPEAKPEHTRRPEQEQPKPSKEAKPKQEQLPKQEGTTHEEGAKQQEGAKRSHEEHGQNSAQAQQKRATGKGHIPDDKFRANFGRQHTFVISRPVIVDNQPRFQYGSYWFEIVDAWPADWAYTDDCYIDYVDGDYFLFDLLHPGERIAVFVVM